MERRRKNIECQDNDKNKILDVGISIAYVEDNEKIRLTRTECENQRPESETRLDLWSRVSI